MKPIERVLVIDDDVAVHYITKRLLGSLGMDRHAQFFNNGAEGLEYIREVAAQGGLPPLILLDIHMPIMDGFQFLEELEKLNLNLSNTKIVLLSSSQTRVDKERAAKSLATEFLQKPLTKAQLSSIME